MNPPSPPPALSDADKERIKLSAAYLNGLAIATFAVGGLAPFFAQLYDTAPSALPFLAVIAVSVVCILISGAIHWVARRALKGLSP